MELKFRMLSEIRQALKYISCISLSWVESRDYKIMEINGDKLYEKREATSWSREQE